MTEFSINSGMAFVDWFIIGVLIVFLTIMLMYCRKFMRSSADFLAANRCAGRYVLCISQGIAGFAVVNSVATFEMFYIAGFSSTWWAMLTAPLILIMSLVGWVLYRLRETRCFTLAQFFEVRYSRRFRVFAGIVTWVSGIFNYGIFPAVSVRFFMFFCRMPEHYELLGICWDVYAVMLTVAIGTGLIFTITSGQVGIMVTDFIQGVLCNVSFIVFILFIFKIGEWDVSGGYVSWNQIAESLETAPGRSQVNPFECTKIPDFNIWYFLIGLARAVYTRGAWQGSMGYTAAAKNPHESKMAGILGTWRGMAQGLMIMLFPLAVIVFMRHGDFAPLARTIRDTLAQIGDTQLRAQGLVPTALSLIMPTGLMGLFVAVMFSAMLSTDTTYMHSWGAIFIQDVVIPLRRKPLEPGRHILYLRLSIAGVAVFVWIFSYFFRQTDYVYMFFAATGAIVCGSGATIIGGLYWKRGGLAAAWITYIGGALVAITGIVLQQVWCFEDGSGLARYLAERYQWAWVLEHMQKFPINGQWLAFIGILSCIVLYVGVSLIEHYVFGRPDFNLDRMLHRGEYDIADEHHVRSHVGTWAARLGITPEFSVSDKMIYGATIFWSLGWLVVFLYFTVRYFGFGQVVYGEWTGGVDTSMWLTLWHVKIYVTLVLALLTTVWLLCGGLVDLRRLFRALKAVKINNLDDGTVQDGHNAGE